jgi:hypothetical protein
VTTEEVRHPDAVPEGLFEYQHSAGDSLPEAIEQGLRQWADMDLPPLLQAVRPAMKTCTMMEMKFPEKDGRPARVRQGILGGVAYYRPEAAPAPACGEEGPHPPFCTCCLLTNSFQAFKACFEADRFLGIRLFASRDENGRPDADCRINGVDWEPGKKALRKYAATWPNVGFEFRKQYVVLHTPKVPATP